MLSKTRIACLATLGKALAEPHMDCLWFCATETARDQAKDAFVELAGDAVLKVGLKGVHLTNGSSVYFRVPSPIPVAIGTSSSPDLAGMVEKPGGEKFPEFRGGR